MQYPIAPNNNRVAMFRQSRHKKSDIKSKSGAIKITNKEEL